MSSQSTAGGGVVKVRVPTQLRSLTGGAGEVPVNGSTVGDVLASLEAAHPGFGERLFDESGKLRRFVNVFVADEDVRFLQGLDTPVEPGQTLSIVPAVAGGADGIDRSAENRPQSAPERCRYR